MRGNENYIRSEVANLPKILNGPEGNEASKTATSENYVGKQDEEEDGIRKYDSPVIMVIMVTFHLWNKRLIFTSEEVPASLEVFSSIAELCSVALSLSSML